MLNELLLKKGVFPVHVEARLQDCKGLPPDRPCYISGPVGSGKTYLAVAYLAESLEHHLNDEGAGIKFCRAVDLINALRDSFKMSGPSSIIDSYQKYRFLIIDDLGTERDTPLVQEALYMILDYRAGHRLPTLITSNFSLEKIASQYGDYGERIASRIGGMGPALILKGKDRRIQK